MSLIIPKYDNTKVLIIQDGQQFNCPHNLLYQSTQNERLIFARVIASIWIMQNLVTISICEFIRSNITIKQLFFTYQYTPLTGILALLTLFIIYIIRFTKLFRNNNITSTIIFLVFTISYALTISAWMAGEKSTLMYMNWTATIGLIIYDLIICWTWYLVIYLLLLLVIKSPLTWRVCVIQLFICGSSVIIFTYFYYQLRQIVFAYVIGVLLTYFHLYYHFSLTQLFAGKYKLKNDEYIAGTQLQYVNLLIPC